MLQNVEYLSLPLIKMLNFDSISGLKASLKFQQTAKVSDNNLTICKLSILLKNTYKI